MTPIYTSGYEYACMRDTHIVNFCLTFSLLFFLYYISTWEITQSSIYKRRRIYITSLLHLINLKANVTIEYDDQPIDMPVSPHMSIVVTSLQHANCHTRTPFNFATYLCTLICESNTNAFRICHVEHNPQYVKWSRIIW